MYVPEGTYRNFREASRILFESKFDGSNQARRSACVSVRMSVETVRMPGCASVRARVRARHARASADGASAPAHAGHGSCA